MTHNHKRLKALAASTTIALSLAAHPVPAQASTLPGLGNLGDIGGQLTEGVNNAIGGIVTQLQTYLQQLQALPEVAMEHAQTYLGELLEGNPDVTAALGELGIVDPDQVRQTLLDAAVTDGRMPAGLPNVGVEAAIAGRTIAQGTLSQEAQARTKAELESIVETVSDSQALAQAATERVAPDQQAADNAVQAANQAESYSTQSDTFATEGSQLAGQAQSATSTQDVLKLLTQQTANNGLIMSQLSAQLGGSSNQLGQLASQLNSHSNQNASSAELEAKAVELSASIATSLEENNVLLGGATLNLAELNDAQRGERMAQAIKDQAEAGRLSQVNRASYRLAY